MMQPSSNPGATRRGFTMVELLVVVGILVLLAAISVPIVSGAIRSGQKAGCLSKLREIGVGLESYLGDHNDRFPDIEMGTFDPSGEVPTLEGVLAAYLPDPDVFRCPADDELHQATGSSYFWNSTQSGRHRLQTSFLGTENRPELVPLVLDKEAFHGEVNGTNILFADYSISNRVSFDAGSR